MIVQNDIRRTHHTTQAPALRETGTFRERPRGRPDGALSSGIATARTAQASA
jgi:hypothetical protein